MKKKKLLIIVGTIILVALGSILFFTLNGSEDTIKNTVNKIKKQEKKLQIYDENSDERPIAVMIPNDSWGGAQDRHYGLQKAYLVYEIIAEGNITRFEALFKDQNIDKIGPVRSSRHYYLDYVLENDAIYVHFGWSPQAQSDIKSLGINNLNGIYNPSNMFWRDEELSQPNNAYTSTEKIYAAAKDKNYNLKSDDYKNLNYSIDEVNYTENETYKEITSLNILYSSIHKVTYDYNLENHYFLRSHISGPHIDNENGNQIHVKNILVLEMSMSSIDDYGRNNLYNTGEGKGYYITNGGLIDIVWKKDNRSSKTKFYDLNDNEIKINDGNTWIQIIPSINDVSYDMKEE